MTLRLERWNDWPIPFPNLYTLLSSSVCAYTYTNLLSPLSSVLSPPSLWNSVGGVVCVCAWNDDDGNDDAHTWGLVILVFVFPRFEHALVFFLLPTSLFSTRDPSLLNVIECAWAVHKKSMEWSRSGWYLLRMRVTWQDLAKHYGQANVNDKPSTFDFAKNMAVCSHPGLELSGLEAAWEEQMGLIGDGKDHHVLYIYTYIYVHMCAELSMGKILSMVLLSAGLVVRKCWRAQYRRYIRAIKA